MSSWLRLGLRTYSPGIIFGGVIAFAFFYYFYKSTGDIVFARSVTFAAVGVNSLIYVFSTKTLKRTFLEIKYF